MTPVCSSRWQTVGLKSISFAARGRRDLQAKGRGVRGGSGMTCIECAVIDQRDRSIQCSM